MTTDTPLPPIALKTWLLEVLCPYWSARIVDPAGGFFESLDTRGQALLTPEKTLLNQARATFTFSLATLLGGDAQTRAAADHGFAFLDKLAQPDEYGLAWPRAMKAQGQVLNGSIDAYESSFVILAMAYYHRATGSKGALKLGEMAYTCLAHRLHDPVHGGFFEEHPFTAKLPRRQNPHMHLLEATLAMYGATQLPIWLDRATALVDMFQRAFFDAETGSLGEYFEADWRPAAGHAGTLREPGHQFEWVWLLQQYVQATGRTDLEAASQRLFQFGTQHGFNTTGPMQGAVYDEVDATGALRAQSMLMWPQTEYVKACVARFDATGQPIYREKALAHWQLIRTRFFREGGCNWVNQMGTEGQPLVSETLSRVLYHVVHAASELARLENA